MRTDHFPYLEDSGGMSNLIRTYDWESSSVGTPDQWPQSLHSAVNIALSSGFPIAIYWGQDFTMIYNDAWSAIPGDKHPWALGKPGKEVWPEIWEGLHDQFNSALSGTIIRSPDSLLLMHRYGYTEECYFDYSLSPIRDEQGKIGGVFNAVIETSYRFLNERRNIRLNQLAKLVNTASSRSHAYSILSHLLESMLQDIPFSLVYRAEKEQHRLAFSTGVASESIEHVSWPVETLRKHGGSVAIKNISQYISEPITTFWPEPCEEAMIVALQNTSGAFAGFVVAGINPRKRLDNDYKHFIESVAGYIGTTIANGSMREDEIVIKKQLLQREESLRKKIEEQLKLVALVDNSVDLMSILELDGKNSYLNTAGMRMLGFDNIEQVLMTPIAHLHEPEDIEFVQANVLPGVMNNGRWSGEMNVKHLKTGEVFPVINNTVRIDDPVTNKPLAIGAVMRDLRPELAARKALIESEQNLRNIILQAPVAMCLLIGPEHVVQIANEAMMALWGRERSAVMNKPVFEGLPDARQQGLENLLSHVYTTGQSVKGSEVPVMLLRGGVRETVYQNFVYEPYRDAQGKVTGIIAVSVDVTDQVLARQKIEEIVEQRTRELADANTNLTHINYELKQSNINLGEFAYAASHDLKEPARKIHIFADRLQHLLAGRLTEDEKHYLERMQVTALRMTTLINDLLNYSEVNQQNSQRESVDLNELFKQVLIDLDLEIEQKYATINFGSLPHIEGNRRQLQQAFHNLISNALKYSKPGTPPVINIEGDVVTGAELNLNLGATEKLASYLLIKVSDNGLGFNQVDAERIFNVFTRVHETPGHKGTGVGLSIVRKVAQNHNGYVWAQSTSNVGSIFFIALPIVL